MHGFTQTILVVRHSYTKFKKVHQNESELRCLFLRKQEDARPDGHGDM